MSKGDFDHACCSVICKFANSKLCIWKILKKLNKSEFLFTILISLLIDIFRFNIQNKYELQFQNIWK